MKKIIVIVICVIGILFLISSQFVTVAPSKYEATKLQMNSLKESIQKFKEANGRLPKELGEISHLLQNRGVKDGWDGQIYYIIQDDGNAILVSYGKDGKKGGEGDNADYIESFSFK